MAMSRKQYRDMAAVINDAGNEHFDSEVSPEFVKGWMLSYVASGLASVFEIDNARFDRDKFMEACFPADKE